MNAARTVAMEVKKPYRAEGPPNKQAVRTVGTWRVHIEEAMSDARAMGIGARVVSANHVVLAVFQNAAKFMKAASTESYWPGPPRGRRGRRAKSVDNEAQAS